ncbi:MULTISPECIES: DUF397 domain-containing protein [Streptomyces]|uniref:DUF397 domain-containing protein n=2 Tax=Streptomyces TaxID=1883 RepID=A0A100Y472_9ACTN|nr:MULTISPECIES: DUF397 domain-containing protein [Streptomyces]KUH37396.1 hypothetical protein ATE80_18245 [Streptomyces kanasensis]UUS31404.1 DUF397 domain-containing protein [Streptomyces changanensis]
MTERTEFQFVTAAACRDARVNNCPEIALNVPGVVALRDSERPDTVVTMTPDQWATLTAAIKGGEFDLSA